MNKPVALCDLDDTLFQTRRKMLTETQQAPVRVGAFDREQQPRSFMSAEQAMMVDWLLATAELIPVTARGTEETSRVAIPFSSWKVMTHGAVIANPDGSLNREWQAIVCRELADIGPRLVDYRQQLSDALARAGIDGWCRMNVEYGQTPVYFVMKHRDSTRIEELYAFNQRMMQTLNTDGFYIHANGNNIAWLPLAVQKGRAVAWLLQKLRQERGRFPVLGLGDSLSDFSFMQHCDWFGMPSRSQFTQALREKVFAGGENVDTF